MHNPDEWGSRKNWSMTRFRVLPSKFETIVEEEICPESMLEFHAAMEWPEDHYAGNRFIDENSDFELENPFIDNMHTIMYPSIPTSWERRER